MTNNLLHQTKLKLGDIAPSFEALNQFGNTINTNQFLGKKLIIYFFSKIETGPCAAQTCNLNTNLLALQNLNIEIVGVGSSEEKVIKKFSEKQNIQFSLIADTQQKIMNAFDVWGWKEIANRQFIGMVRTSFLINETGVIEGIINKVDTRNHTKQIFALLKKEV